MDGHQRPQRDLGISQYFEERKLRNPDDGLFCIRGDELNKESFGIHLQQYLDTGAQKIPKRMWDSDEKQHPHLPFNKPQRQRPQRLQPVSINLLEDGDHHTGLFGSRRSFRADAKFADGFVSAMELRSPRRRQHNLPHHEHLGIIRTDGNQSTPVAVDSDSVS